MIGCVGRFVAAALLCAASCGAAIAAELPFASVDAFDRYVESHRRGLERRLDSYNEKHRLAVTTHPRSQLDLHSWEIAELGADQALVELKFQVGDRVWNTTLGGALFELRWDGEGIEIAGHREEAQPAEVQTADASSGVADGPPVLSPEEVEAYIESHQSDLERSLDAYNKKHRLAVSNDPRGRVKLRSWNIEELGADRAFVFLGFEMGDDWNRAVGEALFELRWDGESFAVVGHRPGVRRRGRMSGWQETGDEECVHNYYAPRPCSGAIRAWTAFAQVHGLALDPESAAIYQSYKHNDVATGNRLMARARGMPDPDGGSVFGLQAEVRAMNLGRYQRTSKTDCDLNPLGPRPCIEILPIYQDFIRRHGLAEDPSSATLFEAYAQGNYKKADVIYALAKGFDVPAYGYLPTGAARDVAKLWPRLNLLLGADGRAEPCSANPYMPETDRYKPCAEMMTLWREFAGHYQLEDNAQNAGIFAQYAAGEYRAGDQLLAEAKGVSLEQLLEASGVPTDGLVIEVYPGTPQRMGLGRMGS